MRRVLSLACAAASLPSVASAQQALVDRYFATDVPGFDVQRGVTVLTRQRPSYEELGVHAGDFVIRADLDEAFGYNSNITGVAHGPSSTLIRTSPTASATSNWSRDRLGFSVSIDDFRYLDAPRQSHTDATVSIGGGYTIGRSSLDVGYSHLSLHQNGTDIAAVASTVPLLYNVDTVRANYTFDFGRITFTPAGDITRFTFDNAVIGGINSGQTFRDRVVGTIGVTTKYALSDQRRLLLITQGVESHYTNPQAGQPSNNSKSVLVLGGLDYQADGPWRYRLLAGFELRNFQARQYKDRVAPIVEASVIYQPTGLTTLTGTLSRVIEDPSSEGNSGYVYNTGRLFIDHEYLRNVLLQARGTVQYAEFLQGGGTQTIWSLGGGATWLLNRHMRLSANYDFSDQRSSGGAVTTGTFNPSQTTGVGANGLLLTGPGLFGLGQNTVTSGNYTQSLFLLNLHLGL